MSFPRYPKYKDSGVEWLGDVPAHWSVEPFKRQIERNDGGVWGNDADGVNDTIVLRSTEQTVDGRWQLDDPAPRKLSESEINAALLIEGDLLLTKSSGSSLHIGKTTLVTPEIAAMRCCYSNFMQRIRTRSSFSPKLAWHVLNNELARRQFDLLSNSTTGLANLNGTMVGQIIVPVPPISEQTHIAAFLDRETAKIDELVAEQRRLMELLKEKRQAVISHAVTQGLNPDASMKPSGLAWPKLVPAHWEVLPLTRVVRHFVDYRGVTPTKVDVGVPLITAVQIKNGRIDHSLDPVFISEKEYISRMTRGFPTRGDLLLTTEAPLGEAALIEDENVSPGQRMILMKVKAEKITSIYLLKHFQSMFGQRELWTRASGSTASGIRADRLRASQVLVPPLNEQRSITDYVREQTAGFDEIQQNVASAINLLNEHRAALISAAVTGQIDVRGLVESVAA